MLQLELPPRSPTPYPSYYNTKCWQLMQRITFNTSMPTRAVRKLNFYFQCSLVDDISNDRIIKVCFSSNGSVVKSLLAEKKVSTKAVKAIYSIQCWELLGAAQNLLSLACSPSRWALHRHFPLHLYVSFHLQLTMWIGSFTYAHTTFQAIPPIRKHFQKWFIWRCHIAFRYSFQCYHT